ncbi:MAG TPA: efflux RND transporter periplasmic adaptor subunit, partial [Bacteroidetes bacterium]|nr:efflux RND transporter periplasmic adaptor subunit [Bacteroidota bacterium]
TQDEVTNFEVRIRVVTPPGVSFRPGMSMAADIETETHTNVLAVPIQSVTVRAPKEEKKMDAAPAEG